MRKLDFEHIYQVHEEVRKERFLREQAVFEAERLAREEAEYAKRVRPPELRPGDRIWRAVYHDVAGVVVIANYNVGPGPHEKIVLGEDARKRPVGILRAAFGALFVKAPIWYAVGGRSGMVVFVYDDFPPGWTHLRVDRVSLKRTSCVATPIVGDRGELLAQYE